MELVVTALLVALTWVLVSLVYRPAKLRSALTKGDIKAIDGHPVIGNLLRFVRPFEEIFTLTRDHNFKYGPRYLVQVFCELSVGLCDAKGAEAILTSSKNISKGKLYEFLMPWLGRGLLTNTGASWHARRKLLTPAFHFRILDQFGPKLERHANNLVEHLKDVGSEPINMVPVMSRCTLKAICETAMGTDLDHYGNEEEYFQAVRVVASSILYRMVRPWTWFDVIFSLTSTGKRVSSALKVLHSFTEKVIQDRKAQLTQEVVDQIVKLQTDNDEDLEISTKGRLAFLDVLLAAQKTGASLTDVDIRNEVDTIMFEGHETTSMALCWTLFMLGNNLDIQESAAQEVVDGGEGWKAATSLKLLERVIKETLRLYPPVYFMARRLDVNQNIGSDEIPAKISTDIHVYDIHRDPAYFPDPERFDPDRFLPENERGRHPFAYIPFSGGLRNCIGRRFALLEMKVVLATILRHFKIRALLRPEEIVMTADLVLRPAHDLMLEFVPRVSNRLHTIKQVPHSTEYL